MTALNRNQPCPCGSGKKYKRCCGREVSALAPTTTRPVILPDGRGVTVAVALQLGVEQHQAGRLRKAAAVYDSVLRTAPHNADALHLLGVTTRQMGNPALALELIGKAIQLQPDTALFHNNLSETYRVLGRSSESLAEAQKALTLQPGLAEAHYNVGMALRELGNPHDALAHFRMAIQAQPQLAEAYIGLSQALCSLGNHEEMLETLRTAAALAPRDLAIIRVLGEALRLQKHFDEAISHFQAALADHPRVGQLYTDLAAVYSAAGDKKQMAECYRKLLALEPDNAVVRHLLNAAEHIQTDAPPREYVRNLFDNYAAKFEDHLVNKLEYRAHELVGNAIKTVASGRAALDSIDLGCGTGLLGKELRAISRDITGVDVAPKMIEKARNCGVYDRLVTSDLEQFLERLPADSVDVIAATDVFIYVGRLDKVFQECSRVLRSGGILAYSLESLADEQGTFALMPTARYAHSNAYILQLCTCCGFGIAHQADVVLRKEHNEPVAGYIHVLTKDVT